jgi:hypothetical protein
LLPTSIVVEIPNDIRSQVKILHEVDKAHNKKFPEAKPLMDMFDEWRREVAAVSKEAAKVLKTIEDKPMKREAYKARLVELGVAKQGDDVDVCHILANANGGADHPHNYVFLLSSKFNRSIQDKCDELNCYISGYEKKLRAIQVSREQGNDPRNGRKATLSTTVCRRGAFPTTTLPKQRASSMLARES